MDLNADVGEGMDDALLLPYVTSANVACGVHAGDPTTMDQTVLSALTRGVRVGAHPGYPDRARFGRVFVEMSADEIENLIVFQVGALAAFVRSRAGKLTHVKPHGALYHSAGEFPDVARAIAEGVRRVGDDLVLVGAAGSLLIGAGEEAGLVVAEEAFADRRYRPDGTLVPRGEPGALLLDPDEAAEQAVGLARDAVAIAHDGTRVPVRADTICLHGDTPGAVEIAKRIHGRFRSAGIRIAPFERNRSSEVSFA